MLIIDTHCHILDTWAEPAEVLLFQMERAAVSGAVLVQMVTNFDNGYVLDSARRFPGRFVVVGRVDPRAADAGEKLVSLAEQGAKGVRLGPLERSLGSDPLILWRMAMELGLVVDTWAWHGADAIKGFASSEFAEIIELLPDLPVIIEHLGYVANNPEPPHTDYQDILSLARYPNTYMKIPGLGEIVPPPMPYRVPPYDFDSLPPFVEMAIEAFGPDRLMIGSDHPRCSSWEGYANTIGYLKEYLTRYLSEAELEAVLGMTAANLFGFDASG